MARHDQSPQQLATLRTGIASVLGSNRAKIAGRFSPVFLHQGIAKAERAAQRGLTARGRWRRWGGTDRTEPACGSDLAGPAHGRMTCEPPRRHGDARYARDWPGVPLRGNRLTATVDFEYCSRYKVGLYPAVKRVFPQLRKTATRTRLYIPHYIRTSTQRFTSVLDVARSATHPRMDGVCPKRCSPGSEPTAPRRTQSVAAGSYSRRPLDSRTAKVLLWHPLAHRRA